MKLIKSNVIKKCACCHSEIFNGWQYKLSRNKYIHFECKTKKQIVVPSIIFKMVSA